MAMGALDYLSGTSDKRNAAKRLEAYNNAQADIYASKTREQFGDLAAKYEALQGTEKLDGLGNANAWLDPSTKYQQQQATDQVLNVFGGSGNLFGGAAKKAVSDRQQQIAGNAWQQALSNYTNQTNANNQMAMQGNAQNFGNNFQTASMINQADATKFNTATQGRANVASIQGPSIMDVAGGLGKLGLTAAATYFGGPAGGAAAASALK